MMAFLKKNWVTVLIVLATVILAGVAIYTAVRLYQLRQTSVAPNAPSSQPGAFQYGANCGQITTEAACQEAECTWKVNTGKCTAGNACLITFSLSTTASPSPSGSPTSTPTLSPSPTPTIPPSCGSTCSDSTDCLSGMTCNAGLCRNPSCTSSTNCLCTTASPSPSPTATPTTPLSCGDSCTTNADCANNMVCSSGVCRNPSCLNSANCLCATSGPTAPPIAAGTPGPSLPESGTSTPAIIGAGLGILLLLGAFMLAL